MCRFFIDKDCAIAEINAARDHGPANMIALDAQNHVHENAMYGTRISNRCVTSSEEEESELRPVRRV